MVEQPPHFLKFEGSKPASAGVKYVTIMDISARKSSTQSEDHGAKSGRKSVKV